MQNTSIKEVFCIVVIYIQSTIVLWISVHFVVGKEKTPTY